MRVLICAPLDPESMPIGGIASFIRGFVKYAPVNLELGVVGTTSSADLGVWRDTTLEGRRIAFLAVARSRRRRGGMPLSATYTLGLARHRRAIPADGSVLQFHRPATALPLLRRPNPKVRVVHLTIADLTTRGSESSWRYLGLPLRAMERLSLGHMQRVYVVNEQATSVYRKLFPRLAGRIEYVPNWVDDAVFAVPDEGTRHRRRLAIREALEFDPDVRIALYAGRLEGQKDPLLLVRGLAAAMTGSAELRAIIAGEGTLKQAAMDEARRLGVEHRMRFLGPLERDLLAQHMVAADLLVISSIFETGPTIGLEALASGLPVVTTRVGTVAGLVEAHRCGAIAGERSPEALGLAIEETLHRDVATLREACLEAIERYRARSVLGRLYDEHRDLALTAGATPGPT